MHPFAQLRLPPSGSVFRSPVAGALHSLVADHVVQGRVIFPGAGYLEMARAATGTASALRGVFFLQPLAAEAAALAAANKAAAEAAAAEAALALEEAAAAEAAAAANAAGRW